MRSAIELTEITITPQTESELYFFQEMLTKMKTSFVISKTEESLLVKFEEGLIEAKKMKEGKIPKKTLRELYENG